MNGSLPAASSAADGKRSVWLLDEMCGVFPFRFGAGSKEPAVMAGQGPQWLSRFHPSCGVPSA